MPTTILIVDDNDFVRAAMRKILEARADVQFVVKPLMDARRWINSGRYGPIASFWISLCL
jgi:hypothetical protein